MPRGNVFNRRKSRLLRRRISVAENVVSATLGIALLAVIAWTLGQRNAYDPGERDLAPELLRSSVPGIEIYNPPMQPWTEPGQFAAPSAPDLGLFPEDVIDRQWRPVGRVRKFGADNLYEKINGEAEKFIKQGFKEMHYLVLRQSSVGGELAIELYDQGHVGGSLGIFGEHLTADQVRETAGGVTFHLTSAGVIGRIDRYFFRAAGDRISAAITEKSRRLAAAFAALVSAQPPRAQPMPDGMALLTGAMGLAESAVTYQASNVFQYDFARSFWFGALDGGGRIFIHYADSDADATTLLDRLGEEQGYEYQALDSGRAWDLYEHGYLKTYFAVARKGRHLFGVDNLRRIDEVEARMRKLTAVLADE